MRPPLVVVWSMVIGAAFALVSCGGDPDAYGFDERDPDDIRTYAELESRQQDEWDTSEAVMDEIRDDEATRGAKWLTQHPQG